MSVLDQITTAINGIPETASVVGGTTFYGLTRLITKDDRTFPVCDSFGRGSAIVPERGKPLQVYHRIEGEITLQDQEGEGFGAGVDQIVTYQHSIFGFAIREEAQKAAKMETYNLALALVNALAVASVGAAGGFTINSNVRRVWLRDYQIQSNDRTVIDTELAGNDYGRDQLDVMAFRIRFTVSAKVCGDLCSVT